MERPGVFAGPVDRFEAGSEPPRRAWLWIAGAFVGYFVLVTAGIFFFSSFDESSFHLVMQRWPRDGSPVWLSHFATWDAAHYLYLSEVGYQTGVTSCAFYPLWPLLIRAAANATGASHVWTGLVLANLFAVTGFGLFWRIVRERFGGGTAWWACGFLFLFPGSLFFHFIYTEPLFFLLLMLMIAGLSEGRYRMAWMAAFLLPMTRAIGLFSIVPLVWHLSARQWNTGGRGGVSAPPESGERLEPGASALHPKGGGIKGGGEGLGWKASAKVFLRRDFLLKTLVMMAAPLLGLALYLGLMWHWTGNPFEGFEAQKNWNAHSIGNLFDLPSFVAAYLSPSRWHAFRGSALDRCVFVLFLCTLPFVWRLDREWFIWALVLGLVPAMSGHFVSYTRFASMAFPMFIALAVLLREERLRWFRWGLLGAFAVLHLILVWRFVNFRWAG